MSTPVIGFRDAAEADGGVSMLDLSLPVPDDPEARVRALEFLNETVQVYIEDYCRGDAPAAPRAEIEVIDAAPSPAAARSVSLAQAIQVFLCFFICLAI